MCVFCFSLLLIRGANIDVTNAAGETPQMVSRQFSTVDHDNLFKSKSNSMCDNVYFFISRNFEAESNY